MNHYSRAFAPVFAAAMMLPNVDVQNIAIPPQPPIAPIVRPIHIEVQDAEGGARSAEPEGAPTAAPVMHEDLAQCIGLSVQGEAGSGVPNSDTQDLGGFSGGDIDTMMQEVMMQASKDQEQELKDVMEEMQSHLKEKSSLRGAKGALEKLADCVGADEGARAKIREAVAPFTHAIDTAGGTVTSLMPQFTSSGSFKNFLEDKAKGRPDIKTFDIASTSAHVVLRRTARLFGFIPLGYDTDVTIGETGSTTAKGPWWLFATKNDLRDITDSDNLKNKLDNLGEMGETQSLRLQMAQDRLAKMMDALSALLGKVASTSEAITPNLK
jgi:hypothetical protein